MIYECDGCSTPLPAGVMACPKCGEKFDDAVPADAEVPRKGFTAVGSAPPLRPTHPDSPPSPGAYSWLDSPAPAPPNPPATGSAGLRVIGCLLLLGGLGLAGYYFLFFDPSIAVPTTEIFGNTIGGGRVNNMGLMAERQNGIMIGMGGAILGAILMYAGRKH